MIQSRAESNSNLGGEWSVPITTDLIKFSSDQKTDTDIQNLINSEDTALKIKNITCKNIPILADVSTKNVRPIVPVTFRKIIFDSFHNTAHIGANATIKVISQRYVWPKMNSEIRKLARYCKTCQLSKVSRHTIAPLQKFPPSSGRLQDIHCDLVGPLPPSHSYRYLLTIIDRVTRWPEAIPIPDMSAQTVVDAFLMHWVARYGVPTTCCTDQAQIFKSTLWTELMNILGCQRKRSCSYHPQAQGMIERFHRSLKNAIKAQTNPTNWVDSLPLILLSLRTAVKQEIGLSPAEMLYGTTLQLPGEILMSTPQTTDISHCINRLRNYMRELRPVEPRLGNRKTFVSKELFKNSHVFVRVDRVKQALERPYTGPHLVISRNPKFFKLDIHGQHKNISIDRLKPAFICDPPQYVNFEFEDEYIVPAPVIPAQPAQPRAQRQPQRRLRFQLQPQNRHAERQPNPQAVPGQPIIRTRSGRQSIRPDYYQAG